MYVGFFFFIDDFEESFFFADFSVFILVLLKNVVLAKDEEVLKAQADRRRGGVEFLMGLDNVFQRICHDWIINQSISKNAVNFELN